MGTLVSVLALQRGSDNASWSRCLASVKRQTAESIELIESNVSGFRDALARCAGTHVVIISSGSFFSNVGIEMLLREQDEHESGTPMLQRCHLSGGKSVPLDDNSFLSLDGVLFRKDTLETTMQTLPSDDWSVVVSHLWAHYPLNAIAKCAAFCYVDDDALNAVSYVSSWNLAEFSSWLSAVDTLAPSAKQKAFTQFHDDINALPKLCDIGPERLDALLDFGRRSKKNKVFVTDVIISDIFSSALASGEEEIYEKIKAFVFEEDDSVLREVLLRSLGLNSADGELFRERILEDFALVKGKTSASIALQAKEASPLDMHAQIMDEISKLHGGLPESHGSTTEGSREKDHEIKQLQQTIERIYNSHSYRLGNALVKYPSKVMRFYRNRMR